MSLQHPNIPNWATPKWNTKLKKNENREKTPRKLKYSELLRKRPIRARIKTNLSPEKEE